MRRLFSRIKISFLLISLLTVLLSCKDFNFQEEDIDWDTICVTATAYNSVSSQTEGDAKVTAWGDTLKPGMNVIAVSRDLIKMGLDHNAPVKIEGFEGTYLVKDKMHHRWKRRIDIYMGDDVQKARQFGRKRLNLAYIFEKDSPDK